MRALTAKVTLVLIALICLFSAGCGPQEAPDVRKCRLIAVENKKLLDQLDRQGRQIVELKAKYAEDMATQKKLLDECNAERSDLKEQVKGQIETKVEGVLGSVMDQNVQLRQQIAQLQAELDALKNKPDTQ